MKSVRDNFLSFFINIAESLSDLRTSISIRGAGGNFAGLKSIPIEIDLAKIGKFFKPIAAWLKKPDNRTQALLALWVFLVFVLFIFTATSIFGLRYLTASYKPGIAISTFAWAFFLGICILFFLPSKIITTIFGGLAGIGINELGTDAGLITKANKALTQIANQIGIIVNGSDKSTDPFITGMVWLFFGVLLITSLPAFFRDK
jgi:hypothetical protein